MKSVLETLIGEWMDRPLPSLVRRDTRATELPGKATVVIGMRRTGKTWYCYQRIADLLASGVPRSATLYLNFEDDRLVPFGVPDFQTLVDVFRANAVRGGATRFHLFLDEVQQVPGWELFARRMLDAGEYTLWLTGSSAKMLSSEIATSMRGRAMTTEMFPLSFAESLRWRGISPATDALHGQRRRAELQAEALRYLDVGGFPEVQELDDTSWRQVLQGYLDIVLMRDVVERHAVTNTTALRWLLRLAMASPANRFSISKLYQTLQSQQVQGSRSDLYEFMEHLCDAYLLYRVEIHSRSQKAKQVNPQKLYAVDTGLLRAVSYRTERDRGALLENIAFMHLRRAGIRPEYYVTDAGHEIDLVLHDEAGRLHLLQVCWSLEDTDTKTRELRAIAGAMRELKAHRAHILTWMDEGQVEGVNVIPAWRWMLQAPADILAGHR